MFASGKDKDVYRERKKRYALGRSSAQQCAWGLGGDCIPCPEGAKCRGEYAIESFPGFFITELPGPGKPPDVQRCPPLAEERCAGGEPKFGNPSNQLSQCSKGYSGQLCAICISANTKLGTPAYYQTSAGLCEICPLENYSDLLKSAGPFVAFIIVVFVLIALVVWRLEIATNYSRSSPFSAAPHEDGKVWACAFMSSKEFCIWTISSAQILASAAASEASGAPVFITKVFKFVSFFNLDTRHIPSFKLSWLAAIT